MQELLSLPNEGNKILFVVYKKFGQNEDKVKDRNGIEKGLKLSK